MGYGLRMSGEIRDWLRDFRDTDPREARLVGEALAALADEGASLGPPLVIALPEAPPEADRAGTLDQSYQDRLEGLQVTRRHVAEAASLAREIELQIGGLESLHAQLADQHRDALREGNQDLAAAAAASLATADGQLAELRRLLPGVRKAEQQLTERSQRVQAQVEAFRTRKEVLKARYTAARGERAVDEAIAASGPDAEDRRRPGEAPEAAAAAAEGKLRQITIEIEQELRTGRPAEAPGRLRPAPGLMELRPGAPGDSDVRILFAIEPAGPALLIAVLEGPEAVRDHYGEAVAAASDLLRRARAGQAPQAAAHAFADMESFAGEFFAGDAAGVEAGAAALAAGNRGRTLAQQRARLGLTQAQVAARMRVRQERVSAIERAEPGATEVRTLASYVEALGGRLEIIADFAGERTVLR